MKVASRTERRANRAFALGLVSLPLGVLGPFAIVSGWRSLRAMAASGGTLTGEGRAVFGLVAGSLSTGFLILGVARFVFSGVL
jgi:hypothetical protein